MYVWGGIDGNGLRRGKGSGGWKGDGGWRGGNRRGTDRRILQEGVTDGGLELYWYIFIRESYCLQCVYSMGCLKIFK